MKNILGIFLTSTISITALGQESVKVTIDSLTNTSGGGSMEACGTAVHSARKKPLLVTIKHDQSYYTTLTAPNGIWCSLIKRWTYNGSISVGATSLDEVKELRFEEVAIPTEGRDAH